MIAVFSVNLLDSAKPEVLKKKVTSTAIRQKKLSLSTGCPSGRGLKRDFLEVAFSSFFSGKN